MLELGTLVDQLRWSDLILSISFLSNLPSGIATWQQCAFLVCVLMHGSKMIKMFSFYWMIKKIKTVDRFSLLV
jgi:uncharacterized protein YhhL (DUF1145 family)